MAQGSRLTTESVSRISCMHPIPPNLFPITRYMHLQVGTVTWRCLEHQGSPPWPERLYLGLRVPKQLCGFVGNVLFASSAAYCAIVLCSVQTFTAVASTKLGYMRLHLHLRFERMHCALVSDHGTQSSMPSFSTCSAVGSTTQPTRAVTFWLRVCC
jgi:hypothetical protein